LLPCFDGPGREVKGAAMDATVDSGEIAPECYGQPCRSEVTPCNGSSFFCSVF
jgi:hypothetical protein